MATSNAWCRLPTILESRHIWPMFSARNEEVDSKTHCAILLNGEIVGGIGFEIQSGERRLTAQFGYWLGVAYWGRGIATAACRAMTAYAFDRQAIRRLEAAVYVPNIASQRVLEKCGYEREGRLRNAVIKNGVVLDAYLYATVR